MTVEGDRAVVLAGRVATMDSQQTVLDDGVVYVRDTSIVDVRRSSDPVPEGFDAVARGRDGRDDISRFDRASQSPAI
jgi:hypothetical protein